MERTQRKKKSLFFLILFSIFTMIFSFMVGCKPSDPPPASVALNATEITLDVYDTYLLTATKKNTQSEIVWSSSDTNVATVKDGLVSALAEGNATITASAGGASAQCSVTIIDSQTTPVLLVDNEIAVGAGSKYTLTVETRWKGAPIDESIEYIWTTDDENAAEVATIETNENGSSATFTGITWGQSTSYTVSAVVRETVLVQNVRVDVRNAFVRFEFENLTLYGDAYVADVALKDTATTQKTLNMGLAVYDNDVPVADPIITYTYFDNGSMESSATSEIVSISGNNIVALKEGSTEIHGMYQGNDFRLRVSTYKPSVEIAVNDNGNDYLTIETAEGKSATITASVTVQDIEAGERVEKLLVNGFDAYESFTSDGDDYTFTLTRAELPKKGEDLGMKTVTVVTDKAQYSAKAFLVSLIINDVNELDKFSSIAQDIANSTLLWDGYFVLGNDINYNKVFPVFHYYALANELVGSDWNNGVLYGFRGVFDGCGYNINGMEIAQNSGAFIGLLNVDGKIKNVSFTNAKVNANASFLVNSGSGTVENVYIHCIYQKDGASNSDKSGFIYTRGLTDNAKVRNVFIETAVSSSCNNAYSIGGNLNNSGVFTNVYAVGAAPAMISKGSGSSGLDVYGSYKTYGDLINADIDFTSWEGDFWKVVGGLPYPEKLPTPGVQNANNFFDSEPSEYVMLGDKVHLDLADYKTVVTVNVSGVTITSDKGDIILNITDSVVPGTLITVTLKNAYDFSITQKLTLKVVEGQILDLDSMAGLTKPVIEAGRMIDGNGAIDSNAYIEFDISAISNAFTGGIDAYEAARLTIGGIEIASRQSEKDGAVFKYAPNKLIEALKAARLNYGENIPAEIVFVKKNGDNISNMITAQFSVDIVALLITNADDLDHMMVAAQGLCYDGYNNYGGVNGSTGNALGVYKLVNDIYYKEGNADRKYTSEYFTRVLPSSAYSNNNRFPKAIKDGQYGGFQGMFEGNGYTIYDLEFAEESTGLFGVIGQNASIKRVSFVNLVHSGWYGAFAAIQQGGVIQDVYMQISMSAKTDDQVPTKNLFLTADEIAADSSLSGLSAISTGAQAQFRASAAIASYVFKNSEALRVLVEYKQFVTSDTSVNGRRGSLYAYTDISAAGQSKLTNLCAIGTPSQWVRLAPNERTYYFVNSDPGLYASYGALKEAGKDYTKWDTDFWKIEDGVPVPENLVFRDEDLIKNINLDSITGFTKPVIEVGRMIESNGAIKSDKYIEFDMSKAASVFTAGVNNYTATTLTIGGVEFAMEQSANDGAIFKYSPDAFVAALKAASFHYADNITVEIVFIYNDNNDQVVNVQFSVDVVALLIRNADDLDNMMHIAQALCYSGYDNYGGVNGSTGNALGVYKLVNDIYYKEGNADRKYTSEYFTRVLPSSAYSNNNRFPKAIKDGQYGGFQGTFEGNGYTIYDLEFAEESTGLFGVIGQNASIKRVSFVNLVHSGWYGAFAAIQQGGVIQDVYMQVSMSAKTDDQVPTKNLFLTADEIAADSSLSGLQAISTTAQAQFRASAAIASYVFKNSEALRVLVEYKQFVTSDTSVNGRRGSLYAYTDISAAGQSKLTNLCAIGTPSQWVRLAPSEKTYYFVNSDPGLYASYDALRASGKSFSNWVTSTRAFWKLDNGVPVPVNLQFRESDLSVAN